MKIYFNKEILSNYNSKSRFFVFIFELVIRKWKNNIFLVDKVSWSEIFYFSTSIK